MDDIIQKFEFQQILRDAAEYRVLRRIVDAGRGTELAEMEKRLIEGTGLVPGRSRNAGGDA